MYKGSIYAGLNMGIAGLMDLVDSILELLRIRNSYYTGYCYARQVDCLKVQPLLSPSLSPSKTLPASLSYVGAYEVAH